MAFQELVKGTPDWHEKYNSDFQDVHAQLANKVIITRETSYPTDNINDFDLLPNGYCRVNEYQGKMAHSPEKTFNGQVFTNADGFGFQIQTAFRDGDKRYFRSNSGIGWSEWKMSAAAERLQAYNLPLSSGLLGGYGSVYFKNPFGEVSVYFDIAKAENKPNDPAYAFDGTETLATLPAGFRPPHQIPFTATVFKPGQGYCAGIAVVSPEGHIVPGSSGKGATIVRASFSFLAA